MNRSSFLKTLLLALSLGLHAVPASSLAESLRVVTTFSILGDMAQRIGGKRVTVTTLVGADSDTHVYQPTPADARAVNEAQVLIVNGLGFEGWLDRLHDAADFEGLLVTATEGIDVIENAKGRHEDDEHADEGHAQHDHGPDDPHAWQSLPNAEIYLENIVGGLTKEDSAGASYYAENLQNYIEELRGLDMDIRAQFTTLPENRRTVVTAHDAYAYFGREYELVFLAPLGFSTESEASAKDVVQLIEQIRHDGISAVFLDSFGDPRLVQQIARETGASVGGTLYPGALSGSDGPAATYLDMIRHNANTLYDALKE